MRIRARETEQTLQHRVQCRFQSRHAEANDDDDDTGGGYVGAAHTTSLMANVRPMHVAILTVSWDLIEGP